MELKHDIVAQNVASSLQVDMLEPAPEHPGESELHDGASNALEGVRARLVQSPSGSKLRTPTRLSASGKKSSFSYSSPNSKTSGNTQGKSMKSTPDKKSQISSDLSRRLEKNPLSSFEARRSYSATVKARSLGVADVGGLRRTSSNCSISSVSSVSSVSSLSRSRNKPPTVAQAERQKALQELVDGNAEERRSSLDSQSSVTSSISTTSSRRGFSTRKSSRSRVMATPSKSMTMNHTVWPANAPSLLMFPEEFTLTNEAIMALKQDFVTSGKGVQELLSYVSSSSSSLALTTANMKARKEETMLLKAGLRRLSTHAEGLMRCCESFEKRMAEQSQLVEASNAEIERLTQLLYSEPVKQTKGTFDLENFHSDENMLKSLHPTSDSETASTTSSQNIFPGLSNEEAGRQRLEIHQAMQEDSPLSAFVRSILKTATDKIEDKWRARFAEQLAEHEQALAQERERSSASVLSSSRLVTETLHGKDDELKAIQELNLNLNQKLRQLELDLDSARSERDFFKQQMDDEDDDRSVNAHSFWEKTTDLAKQNRNLTEELAQANKTIARLNETIKIMKAKMLSLRSENGDRLRENKSMIAEKNLLQDKLTAMEAKFEDEKNRREQFQVNVEQLNVENTALYAQMVAQQTTHEAKMEELQARYEKRNISLAGEMKLLQDQNRLMRTTEPSNQLQADRSNEVSRSTGSRNYSRVDNLESTRRIQELTEELLAAQQKLTLKTDMIAELESKILEGEATRRKLHNMIQELRGNIRVHVRLRPFLRSDGVEGMAENPESAIMCDTYASTITTNVESPHTFAFDKIYSQSDSQEFVFKDVSDFIQSAMDGYNVCIFAYGQTGSGKTHTMQGIGKAQMRGIIPRSIDLIINCCEELTAMGWNFSLMVTFYEIYNETIRDLLSVDADKGVKHNIRTDPRGRNYVEGLTEIFIDFDQAADQVDEIMNLAACNRSVDRTDMNAHSSRSHSIFALKIHGCNEAQSTEVDGSLSLVDLAGSERLSRSRATGDRLKEAQAINKSLSALADVFQALAKKSPHVPYRNSKLTYALQPALSGEGKTLMMANLSPTYASLDETLCSLRFAKKVSQCELGAPVRQIKAIRRQSLGPGDLSRSSGRTSPQHENRRSTFTPGTLKQLL